MICGHQFLPSGWLTGERSTETGCQKKELSAGILEQSMEARNRVGIL